MDRYLVISSDGHAGPHASEYREYVDPEYRETFDVALPIQIEMTEAAAKSFLVDDINREWRKGREAELSGAWDAENRDKVLDHDGVAAEVLFPDGVTEMNAPPFGAGFTMGTAGVTADLQWAGCTAHNRWMAEFASTAPERRIGLACIPVLWDIDRAVEGIRAAHESGLRGLVFPPRWGGYDGYHHARYDPVWEICQDLDMPIHFHSGPAPIEDYFGPVPAPAGHTAPPGAMGIYITEVAMWLVRPVTFMIWGRRLRAFPQTEGRPRRRNRHLGSRVFATSRAALLRNALFAKARGLSKSSIDVAGRLFPEKRSRRRVLHASTRSRNAS